MSKVCERCSGTGCIGEHTTWEDRAMPCPHRYGCEMCEVCDGWGFHGKHFHGDLCGCLCGTCSPDTPTPGMSIDNLDLSQYVKSMDFTPTSVGEEEERTFVPGLRRSG